MSDSLKGRKLRPLIPKPSSNASPKENTPQSAISTPYCTCIYRANLYALNLQNASTTHDQSKTDAEPLAISRWNPTPEQLDALEEMYQGGMRTPSPEQIQQIAAKLRRFGKIEGKNVFYWFQNHKARERQKRRRMIIESGGSEEQYIYGLQSLETEKSELMGKTSFEVGQTKNWATPNCTTLSEECVSMHRAVGAENGLSLFEERDLQQRQGIPVAKHATWQMMEVPPTYIFGTIATTSTRPEGLGAIDPNNLFKAQEFSSIVMSPNSNRESQSQTTLELFPMRSENCNVCKDTYLEGGIASIDAKSPPNQYFEFLPLKP